MNLDPATTKYLIEAKLSADGIVEKPDVVGAIFGQTEGLLGDELDLRDLQKTGRMGRIEVDISSKKGKSEGTVLIPSSLDQVETAILAASLETIDRIGPCRAKVSIEKIEDVRITKKQKIIDRAKELLTNMLSQSKISGLDLSDSVRQAVQVDEVALYGEDKCPAGPNIDTSDAIILVEGRSDVINLLKYGIKNVIAVGGTNISPTIQKVTGEKVVTAFVDGDRGGDLILKELFQIAEVDFVSKAPKSLEVEELTQKQIIKALRNKVPVEQYMEMNDIGAEFKDRPDSGPNDKKNGEGKNWQERRNERREMLREKFEKNRQPRPPRGPDAPDRTEEPRPAVIEQAPQASTEGEASHDETAMEEAQAPQRTVPTAMSTEVTRYRDILKTLSGTLRAMLINPSGEVVQEIAVRQLADTLRTPPAPIHAVVFDGIISQRLLDIAGEQSIRFLVGSKKGNLTNEPEGVTVLSKLDLDN
ncbi:MAG: DNA primase DnaG [Candidatus Thermoplasmatota archaeon]|jgi:DNA primase|nr:DNA primase DnaG [Candidatus Thermoplasmatota archaeon]